MNIRHLDAVRSAAQRLLQTEAEVKAMPKQQCDWFMSKPGHKDTFALARLVLEVCGPLGAMTDPRLHFLTRDNMRLALERCADEVRIGAC